MIGGKESERIYSYGPSLQFVFDMDDMYKSTAKKILSYFNTNYGAVYTYLRRFDYVFDIYKENEELDQETITNEISINSISISGK